MQTKGLQGQLDLRKYHKYLEQLLAFRQVMHCQEEPIAHHAERETDQNQELELAQCSQRQQ